MNGNERRNESIAAAIESGERYRSIAKRFGLSVQRISDVARLTGVRSPRRQSMPRSSNPNWSGGRITNQQGYVLVMMPQHPRANPHGYVREHVVVAERALGRPLPVKAVVHHVNQDRADNGPGNLVVCEDQAYHRLIHQRMDARAACGNADYIRCQVCGGFDDPDRMYLRPGKRQGHHRECLNQHNRQKYAEGRAV